MRFGHLAVLVLVLICALPGEGRVSGGAARAGAAAHEVVYIATGADYHYAVAPVTRPAELIGAIALQAADAARSSDTPPELPAVTGRAPADLPPPGWTEASDEAVTAMQRGAAPFAAARGTAKCKCTTRLGDTDSERVAALYAMREFDVGDELDDVAVLRLRVKYRDGLVAHINGREVVRRYIDADTNKVAFARWPRGGEWETFYVSVEPGMLSKGKNVLAIEVRPSSRAAAPVLDLELTGGAAPRLVRGPMVQRVGVS